MAVQALILRRLANIIPLLIGISSLSFSIMYLAPGDFLDELRLNPQVSAETIEMMRAQYGLDRPFLVQYWMWFKEAFPLPGNWSVNIGRSFQFHTPVTTLIGFYAFNTFLLSVSSPLLAWLIAFPIAIYAAPNHY